MYLSCKKESKIISKMIHLEKVEDILSKIVFHHSKKLAGFKRIKISYGSKRWKKDGGEGNARERFGIALRVVEFSGLALISFARVNDFFPANQVIPYLFKIISPLVH